MPEICMYFQVHQPHRLHRFRVFDIGSGAPYVDDDHNRRIVQRVSEKCYLPTNRLLKRLIEESGGAFRIAMSLSGVLLEQLGEMAPDTLESFEELIATGGVELLGETYHHSLAALAHRDEFVTQINQHRRIIQELFGRRAQVFRNSELIFSDPIAVQVREQGFLGALVEGAQHILGWRDPTYVYESGAAPGLRLLTRHIRLSDDVAFRFSARGWSSWPLTADTYAGWLAATPGHCVNLFMDYETFGEHQWSETGILDFLAHLPGACRARGLSFVQPTELSLRFPADQLWFARPTSWADQERDVSAWLGNRLQQAAHRRLYALRPMINQAADPQLYERWQHLTTSDHFYYMATKGHSDGEVHAYFNAYASPYDAFVRFMNVVEDLEQTARAAASRREQDVATEQPSTPLRQRRHRVAAQAYVPTQPVSSAPAGGWSEQAERPRQAL
jgi:alpha-amylase